jgi:hypothetical protein
MQCTNCGTQLQPGATVCPNCEERVVPTKKSVAEPRRRTSPAAPAPAPAAPAARPVVSQPADAVIKDKLGARIPVRGSLRGPIIAAIVFVVVAVTAWGVYSVFSNISGNTPDGAALRMMQAYANYDAAGILANATHASLGATDVATFETQAADTKAANGGKPSLKDIVVVSVTPDLKDPNVATVKLTEQILDPAKGTYSLRNETLSVVKQSGKWLVRLF